MCFCQTSVLLQLNFFHALEIVLEEVCNVHHVLNNFGVNSSKRKLWKCSVSNTQVSNCTPDSQRTCLDRNRSGNGSKWSCIKLIWIKSKNPSWRWHEVCKSKRGKRLLLPKIWTLPCWVDGNGKRHLEWSWGSSDGDQIIVPITWTSDWIGILRWVFFIVMFKRSENGLCWIDTHILN